MEAIGYIAKCKQLWDARTKEAVSFIPTEFPITAIALSEAGNELFTGGIDNDIKVWDLRKKTVTHSLLVTQTRSLHCNCLQTRRHSYPTHTIPPSAHGTSDHLRLSTEG